MSESTKTAILSAVITGVFTVLAGIATYWFTTKEPELSYSVVGGPALSSALGAKRIFVVEVRNPGKKEIAQTLVQVGLKLGELSEAASEASPGVKLVEEKTSHQIDIRADLLNQGDSVKVSFLASLAGPGSEPAVVVRAPGVKAIAESSKPNDPFNLSDPLKLLSVVLPALAAVVSTFLVAARIGFFGRLLSSSGPSLDQAELTAYLCGVCGLHDEAEHLRFGSSETSYRGAADYLGQRAQRVEGPLRARYVAALRALLLFSSAAPYSLNSIRFVIDSITSAPMTDAEFERLRREAVDEGNDPVIWRQKVASFVRQQGLNDQTAERPRAAEIQVA